MKPIEIGTFEAKNRLSSLLEQVQKGQRIYITRRGKRIALLTSAEDAPDAISTSGRDLLKQFQRFRKSAKTGCSSLRDLIEEGRH
jgi:prevent-host-death family protein